MKQLQISFNTIAIIALLALTAGCSTTSSTQNKESMLVASGFKVITPKTAAQQQKLQQLPPGHVAMVNRKGRTYYIFPDVAHNQAYVGGPKEYQAYQQLRAENKVSREDLQDAEMYQDATMEWSLWEGGEGVWGPMGGPMPARFRSRRTPEHTCAADEVICGLLPGHFRCCDHAVWASHWNSWRTE